MGTDKLLIPLRGVPVLAVTLRRLREAGLGRMIVGVRPGAQDAIREAVLGPNQLEDIVLVEGGGTRAETVAACLAEAPSGTTHVLVHDAARPHCSVELIARVMAAAERWGAASAGLPAVDTLHEVDSEGRITATPERSLLWQAQTPQGFALEVLARAHAHPGPRTDDAGLVAAMGVEVHMVPGEPANVKLTHPEDLPCGPPPGVAVGLGQDVHRLVPGRPLILGGVHVPSDLGLDGHSDADVLAHAVADAVLGAAGLGDIGRHFPPSDPRWKGADSMDLLARSSALARAAGWRVAQADCLLLAERPRLAPHAAAMAANLARAMNVGVGAVNVKFGTNEGLGYVGRAEGMAAWATVVLARL